MEPAQPDPPEPNPASAEPSEARTVALRPGAVPRPAPEEKPPPGKEPAHSPEPSNPANESTVASNKVAQLRAGVSLIPTPAPEPPRDATVSIHQVQRARALPEVPVPPAVAENAPGTNTVPIRRPVESPPAEVAAPPDPPPPLIVPTRPKPSAPGTIKSRPSAPGTGKRPSDPATIVELDPKLLCPRCRTKLISPESLGMCPSCGYCRSLEEGKRKEPPPQAKRWSLFGLVEFCQLIAMMPLWSWVLLVGMAVVILATVCGTQRLPAGGIQRAWWGTGQFVLGLIFLAVAQGWALFRVAAQDDRFGPWDLLLLSPRVWQKVFERLPRTQGLLWMAGWGVTMTIAALFLTGTPFSGLSKKEEGLLIRELRAALGGMSATDYQSMQSAAREDLETAAKTPAPPERRGDDARPSKPCVVIGYTQDKQGKPNGLIVAAPANGRLRYAGIVRTGLQKSREFLERLGALEKVDGPTEGGAVWVKPKIAVDVHHSGTGTQGAMNEPNLGGVHPNE